MKYNLKHLKIILHIVTLSSLPVICLTSKSMEVLYMKTIFTLEQNRKLVKRHYDGESVSLICLQTRVPRSTFYTWLKPYKATQSSKVPLLMTVIKCIKMAQGTIIVLLTVNYN